MLRREGLNLISLFRNPAYHETGTVGVSQLTNIGSLIAKAHQSNYSFLIFVMYLFLSCKSLLFTLFNSMYNSSCVNAVPEPSAQR